MRKLYTLLILLLAVQMSYGQSELKGLTYDGIPRRYYVYVPASYDGSTAVPLVFNFHGYGSNAPQQELYTQMDAIADTAGFIVVYPDGVGNAWNAFGTSFPGGSTADDIGFTNALIDQLNYDYNIDLSRVYACGMSNGGFMSHYLACELSDRIAAIAPVAGLLAPSIQLSCNATRAMPVLDIHGTADGTVPYGTSGYGSVQQTIDFWTSFNNCNPTPTIDTLPDADGVDTNNIVTYLYTGCDSNVQVLLYKVLNCGHSWPGALLNLNGNTNYDISASQHIWNFFKQYQHPDPADAGPPTYTGVPGNVEPTLVVRYYPNPMTDQLTVEFLKPGVTSLSIFNLLGEEVMRLKGKDSGAVSINTAELRSGVYMLELQYGDKTMTYKLVK